MHTMDLDWPGPTDAIYASDLRRFDFGPKINILFCGTCGTPMFFGCRCEGPNGPVTTSVFTATLANIAQPNLLRITTHIFVGDTVDGGASMWLRHPNRDGTPARRFRAGKDEEELPPDWPASPPLPAPAQGPTDVPVWCKCRGVDLVLRPDFSPSDKDADVPFFVDRETGRLLASFDACDSCRLAVGANIVNWTFALLRHIRFAGCGSLLPGTVAELREAVSRRDPRFGSLEVYESSAGVQRYFCGRCSATVFFACDARPDMVDVAVGLLESPGGGARAEDVLAWSLGGTTTWRQDVKGGWREGLVEAVEKEAERFRIERGLPVSFRRKAKEEGVRTE